MASPRQMKLLRLGTGLLSAVLLSASPAAFPQEKEFQASAEERLLQAELQEASAADLARAAGAYRSLASDEKAPAAVRARALLNLGRTQRRTGELEASRRTLEDLVKTYPGEREVIRQGQIFLRELTTGRSENPSFDWLEQLERSPELQARVLDLCLDLVKGEDERKKALQQILALGPVALPVLERAQEITRDATHRWWLLLAIARCGKPERLPELLERSALVPDWNHLNYFLNRMADQPESLRRTVLAATEAARDRLAPERRALLRILAGERGSLAEDWRALEPGFEPSASVGTICATALRRLGSEPRSWEEVISPRLLDPACPEAVRKAALQTLPPALLRPEHWKALAPLVTKDTIAGLCRTGLCEALEQLPPEIMLERFRELGPGECKPCAATWARLLRRAGEYDALEELAFGLDEAVPCLVDFLNHRAVEAPGYLPLRWIDPGRGARGYSSAHAAALLPLLDSRDPVCVAHVLESMMLRESTIPQDVSEKVSAIIERDTDPYLCDLAWSVLARALEQQPKDEALSARGARALVSLWTRLEVTPATAELTGDSATLPRRQIRSRSGGNTVSPASPLGRMTIWCGELLEESRSPGTWPHGRIVQLHRQLLPPLVKLCDNPEGVQLLGQLEAEVKRVRVPLAPPDTFATPELGPYLAQIKSGALARVLARWIVRSGPSSSLPAAGAPQVYALLARVVVDRDVPVSERLQTLGWAQKEIVAQLDLEAILTREPRAAGELFPHAWETINRHVVGLPAEAAARIQKAGLACEDPEVAALFVKRLSVQTADSMPLIRDLLHHKEVQVRREAARLVGAAQLVGFAPLCSDLLESEDAHLRRAGLERVADFASVEMIPLVTRLLDDPDVTLRSKALDALRRIKAVLEERKEWAAIAASLEATRRAEPPR